MRKRHPKLQTILLTVNIAMLLILLGGINVLRIFENYFIKQTENELNAQAAFISSIYKEAYAQALGQLENKPLRILEKEVDWQPLVSTLDLASSPILDEAPKPLSFQGKVDKVEAQAGQSIIRILQAAQRRTLASMRVVNMQGVVVSSTNLNNQISIANRPEVTEALKGNSQSVLRRRTITQKKPSAHSISRSADIRVHVVHPILYQDKVIAATVLARTPPSLSQFIERHILEISAYVLIVILLVWLLVLFTSYSIRKPIVALVEQARRAEQGEKGAVIPLANPVSREVAELSETVAGMAKSLEQRADYILEFASHISHEFKTPVTAIQGASELLLDHYDSMSVDERNRFLNNLKSDAEHLENLVRRLLDFARADLKKSQSSHCEAGKQLSILIQRYQGSGVSIENTSTIEKPTSINISEEDFDCVVSNLIDNALQAEASHITILSSLKDSRYLMEIKDDGEPISKANQEKIFTPFFTLNKKTGGTGLGLPIISSLLKSCGGRISLVCENDEKIFRLEIPLAQ